MMNWINSRSSHAMLLMALFWVMGGAMALSMPGFVGTAHAADKVEGKMNANPCAATANPCAAKANPCAAKANPCAAKANPCAAKAKPAADHAKGNPCAAKANPCAAKANPCAAKK